MLCCGGKNKNKVQELDGIFEPRVPETPQAPPRRQSIYPRTKCIQEQIIKNRQHIEEGQTQRKEFTDKFLAEIILCGGCSEKVALKDRKQLNHCNNCNNIFCCKFAGACVGDDCSINFKDHGQSLSYCMNCVNPYLKINLKEGGQCLCITCENTPDIPNHYKEI